MPLAAAIVICASLNGVPCDENHAKDVFFGRKDFTSLQACQFETQAYVAESGLMRDGDALRVYCGPVWQVLARFGTI